MNSVRSAAPSGSAAPTPTVWSSKCGHLGARASLRCIANAAVAAAAKLEQQPPAVEIPDSIRNNVVVLEAPNSKGQAAKVYLVGVSHVSKRQAEGVKQLIRAVRPDVIGVELCKDRVGLLVDASPESEATNLWHARKVTIEGLPGYDEAFPTEGQLKELLGTRPGRPVSMQDIEADVFTLLATGLFKSVKPGAINGTLDDAPEFGAFYGEVSIIIPCKRVCKRGAGPLVRTCYALKHTNARFTASPCMQTPESVCVPFCSASP